MPSARFEPAIQSVQIQTYVVDRTALCSPPHPAAKHEGTAEGGRAELQLHSLLTWATDGGKWSAARPG